MVLAGAHSSQQRWARLERNAIGILALGVTTIEVLVVGRLVIDILGGHSPMSPIVLLSTAVGIWTTNIIVFAFAYWQIDRGGPFGRCTGWRGVADVSFYRGGPEDGMPADWQPTFPDYLSLAYNTSTAFSPTDSLPLTVRAKMLMMAQSFIALVTVVMVIARAINVLGT